MVFQKRIIFRLFALCFFPILSNAQSWQTKVNPSVFDELRARQTTEILVTMREQADLSRVSNGLTKEEKGELVVQILRGTAERSQSDMQQFLQTQNVDFQSFWLINAVFLKSDFALLKQLAERSDVATIDNNPHTQQSLLPQNLNLPQPEGVNIPWGILKIKADSVWALGIRGQGAVVGGADTGYDWTHPALKKKYRGWNDTTGVANHNYNWHDAIHPDSTTATNPCGTNQNKPCDDGFHGTHTMGTMIGSVDTQLIGVAPGARWIGTRNMDRGDGTPARYIECFQWFVAPTDSLGRLPQTKLAPHVINNSWGCPPSEGCNLGNFAVMNTVIQNVRKAGIVVVASAGNSGPNCGSVQDPPAMFAPSFSVGATGQNDTIASFSSRGAVSVDSSFRRKPDVSAPGVGVYSAGPGGVYRNLSGTSMSGPHVVGAVALMISANPQIAGQVDTIQRILELTAKPMMTTQDCNNTNGTTIPNNTYGYGRIDVLAAVKKALLYRRPATKTIDNQSFVTVSPNPFSTHLTFYTEGVEGEVLVEIFNLNGQSVFAERHIFSEKNTLQLALPNLSSGVYFYKMHDGKRSVGGKIVKL